MLNHEIKQNKAIYLIIVASLANLYPLILFNVGLVKIDLFKVLLILSGCTVIWQYLVLKKALIAPKDTQLLLLIILLFWFISSSFWAKEAQFSLSLAFVFSLYVFFYFFVILFTKTKHDLYKWAYLLPLSAVVVCFYDLKFLASVTGGEARDLRNIGVEEGHVLIDQLGITATLSVLLLLHIFVFSRKFWAKLYSIILLLVCSVAILISGHRTGLSILLSMSIFYAFFMLRSKIIKKKERRTLTFFIVIMLFVIIGAVVFIAVNLPTVYEVLTDRIIGTFDPQHESTIGENLFVEDNPRAKLWGAALQMFISNPLGGVGLGNFRVEVPKIDPSLQFWEFSHNTFLDLLAETGIIGLMLFLLVVVSAFRNYNKAANILYKAGIEKDYFLVRAFQVTFLGLLLISAMRPGLFEFPIYVLMALSYVSKIIYVSESGKHEPLPSQ